MRKRIGFSGCFITGLFLLITLPLDAQYMDLLWERIAHYPLNNDATDISVYENHGRVYGASLATDRHGTDGQAYSFDGLNDYILCGTYMGTLSSQVSVSCWIKTDGSGDYSHIVSKYDYSADGGFILGVQDGLAIWAGRVGSGKYIRISSRSRIDDNQWHHLIGIINNSNWWLYIDGVLENHTNIEYRRTNLDCSAPLTIGMFYGGDQGNLHPFSGSVDEVILYRRPLNDCEIEFLFTGNNGDGR